MEVFESSSGRRLWYEEGEFDDICESELRIADLYPTATEPQVRIEDFIERHLDVDLDQYADLERDVLGKTSFHSARAPLIEINASLTKAAIDNPLANRSERGRWKATLAHEAGHVLLHSVLFPQSQTVSLFEQDGYEGEEIVNSVFRCTTNSTSPDPGVTVPDWKEYQANRCIGALLMPLELLRKLYGIRGSDGAALDSGSHEGIALCEQMAQIFDVSNQVANIRVQQLGLTRQLHRQVLNQFTERDTARP